MAKVRDYLGNKLFTTWSHKVLHNTPPILHYHYVEVDDKGQLRIYDTSAGPQHFHRYIEGDGFEPEADHTHDLTESLKMAIKDKKEGTI